MTLPSGSVSAFPFYLEIKMDQSSFWMVWNPQGNQPAYQHPTRDSAIAEAERLARKCPGHQFYVLAATDLRVCDNMQRVALWPEQEIPF